MGLASAQSKQPVETSLVEKQIKQRTRDGIRNVSVVRVGDQVVVHGKATSYYQKQLALVAAREAVGSERLVLDIAVASFDAERTQAIGPWA